MSMQKKDVNEKVSLRSEASGGSKMKTETGTWQEHRQYGVRLIMIGVIYDELPKECTQGDK